MKVALCFTGGGTAGHVFPGLAVINSFFSESIKNSIEPSFYWIGSLSGMEKKLLNKSDNAYANSDFNEPHLCRNPQIKFYGIPSGKLRRYFSLKNFIDIFKIAAGLIASIFILLKIRPALIFSKGGYVTAPPVFAAKLLGIPVVSHESDYTPGLATRINKRFSKLIMLSFKQTADFFGKKYQHKLFFSGNPVRSIFYNADAAKGRKFLGLTESIPVIAVIGGSQGSQEINSLIEKILPQLLQNYYVVHQTGEISSNALAEPISSAELRRYKKFQFIKDEIADVLSAADLVVSRAGAGSVWELSALGKASVFIPLRGRGTRGDQVKNALFLKSIDAAVVLADKDISPENLYSAVESVFSSKEKKLQLEKNIKLLGIENSADVIAKKLFEFLEIKS